MIQRSKMQNHTEADLTSKWNRISPAVQWCYQNQSNLIERCQTISPRNLLYGDTHTGIQGQSCTKWIM